MSVRLDEILVKESLITQDQLQKALEFQRANGGKLVNCLTKMGFITDDDITGVLSRQYGVPSINLKDYEIDPNVIKLIPQDTAARYQVLPLSRVGSVLTIAMADPTNVFAIDDIKFMTGFNVKPVVASEAAIGDAITRFYGAPSSNMGCQAIRQSDVVEDYLGNRLGEALSDELETHLLGCPDCSAFLQYMQSLRDGLEERASSIRTAVSRSEHVRQILSVLPARDRDLLRAVLLEEKDKDAVCREMGVDRNYLRVLMLRVKDKFKDQLALAPVWDNLLNED
jgi:Type II secretion system (T2SS), protein E, N-terminal domain